MLLCFQLSATAVPATTVPANTSPPTPTPTLQPVQLGNLIVKKAIILAPMAGVTNAPFRKLCAAHGAELTMSEMLHASMYLSKRITPRFNEHEIRSVQLYGTCADVLSAAAMRLVEEGVQHIDLNFGCPARKIVSRGGGAAIPGNLDLFEQIVKRVVGLCGDVPVTCKMRAGYNGRITFKEAGKVAESCGISGITLHSRTAEELYDRGVGRARWDRIGELVEAVDVPVFGNGDVFSGDDGVELVKQTGCAGVVVGRGCLGRPWLFGDIVEAFRGGGGVTIPDVGAVLEVMLRLVEEIVADLKDSGWSEKRAVASVRKWYAWFLQGYDCGDLVRELRRGETMEEVRRWVEEFDRVVQVDVREVLRERGKLGRE